MDNLDGGKEMAVGMYEHNNRPLMKPQYLVPLVGMDMYVKDMGPQIRSAGEVVRDGVIAAYHASSVFLVGSGLLVLANTIAQYTQ